MPRSLVPALAVYNEIKGSPYLRSALGTKLMTPRSFYLKFEGNLLAYNTLACNTLGSFLSKQKEKVYKL